MAEETDTKTTPTLIEDDVLDNMFGASFADLDAPESENDLIREAGFRVSEGETRSFLSDYGDGIACEMKFNSGLLTALSHGKRTSAETESEYSLVQGQMQINADLYLYLGDQRIGLMDLLWNIFQRFVTNDEDWTHERFIRFMTNAGWPVEGDYVMNFEHLGANPEAIEEYFPIIAEMGAMTTKRARQPQFIEETWEFSRNTGAKVTYIEIGRGDPTRSQFYNKKFEENGNTYVYGSNVFVDPVTAQIDSFSRMLTHLKTSNLLRKQSKEVDDAGTRQELEQRAATHKTMSQQFLRSFGGVHRGAQVMDEEYVEVEDRFYNNRVRTGRFGIMRTEDQMVEFNFWMPQSTEGMQAATATAGGGTEGGGGGKEEEEPQITVTDDDEEVF